MYNPDFWEIPIDNTELEQFPNEAGAWFESGEERRGRYGWEDQVGNLIASLMDGISESLTQRQREAIVLYFLHRKTQQETAEILGISRRVLGQHLFGIFRNGKRVGGAIKKIQKLCSKRGIDIPGRRVNAGSHDPVC